MQMCFYKVSPSSMCPGVTSSSATQTMCLAGQCSSDRPLFIFILCYFHLPTPLWPLLAIIQNLFFGAFCESCIECLFWGGSAYENPFLAQRCLQFGHSAASKIISPCSSGQNCCPQIQPSPGWGGLQLQSRCFRPPWQSSDTGHVKDKGQTLSLQLCHRRPAASIIPVALTSDPIQVFSFQGGLT